MGRCRRCHQSSVELVRDTVTFRHHHQYTMRWYRCSHCQHVSLSYQRLERDVSDPATGRSALSDARLVKTT
jgi:hypothetical protein